MPFREVTSERITDFVNRDQCGVVRLLAPSSQFSKQRSLTSGSTHEFLPNVTMGHDVYRVAGSIIGILLALPLPVILGV